VVTDPWSIERNYIAESGPAAQDAFMAIRSEMTAFLAELSVPEWQRLARHAIFGPTTMQELLSFVVTHDVAHIRQFSQNLNSYEKEFKVS
jgi:Mn-containing catalase